MRICKIATNHIHPFYNKYVSEADIREYCHPLRDYTLQIEYENYII